MQQGSQCPICGKLLRYITQYQNWYCDNCRIYPFIQTTPTPYYPPPRDDSAKTILWIVIIVVVLIIIVPIILAAALYFMVSDMMTETRTTPTVSLYFDMEDSGNYNGYVVASTDTIDLVDVTMTIIDNSMDSSASLDPLVDGGAAQTVGGMSCTFFDLNYNDELDSADTFRVNNGASGDRIRLIYRPTGGLMVSYTLS